MNDFIDKVLQLLLQDNTLVVATIIGHHGSTPRTAGTKMIVRKDGDFFGTIGGGQVEADVLSAASDVFVSGKPIICAFDLTQESMSGMDMICGGRIEVLLDLLLSDPDTIERFRVIQQTLQTNKTCLFVTALDSLMENSGSPSRFLLHTDPPSSDSPHIPSSTMETIRKEIRGIRDPKMLIIEQERFWVEPYFRQSILYLFGAGHVSRPTAVFGIEVGFQVIVLDDRKAFANQTRFPKPTTVKVIPDFKDCFTDLKIDENCYLVIITRGHLHDKIVLAQALKTRACYIGMIGSRRKRDIIFDELLAEGVTREDLKRVHSPIGLNIGAETPEEIAVSIISELIQVRSTKGS